MTQGIAIVGMACIYPDAPTPAALWENVLAQRRSFRRIPRERLRVEDYFSSDATIPDSIYATEAALIRDFEFDRQKFRVAGGTFRSADMAHWLALCVADAALTDAGFNDGAGLSRDDTAVIVGNTLTGEFSRANTLRLRWPYVRRVVNGELNQLGWSSSDSREFLDRLEQSYKSPFPPPGEETLAGGLSNTIAGRICNHFDLHGGGYTVDGACAASLLAVTNACNALSLGDASVALAGGVDLSLDPFELVGFARTGALARKMMLVYDAHSSGFWPGEGCGFVVLMREDDAVRAGRHIYAVIRGWGISSDGSGGITRPEVAGQKLALQRAYRRAGFGPDKIGYFEGHGTGTAVGDETELRALSESRREANLAAPKAAIGSIKANIGHTKAAAGIAGLIKATLAVHEGVIPPITGCEQLHAQLTAPDAALQILRAPLNWSEMEGVNASAPRRAAVSAMGFGGINTHVVLESSDERKARGAQNPPRTVLGAGAGTSGAPRYMTQDAELYVFAAESEDELNRAVRQVKSVAAGLSRGEMGDLAGWLSSADLRGTYRAAVVATSPSQLFERIDLLAERLERNESMSNGASERGVWYGRSNGTPKIGLLFPGQGSPTYLSGGAVRRRFAEVEAIYQGASLPMEGDSVATEIAQPAIAAASAAAVAALRALGIEGEVAVGHSLGELGALHWAGVWDAGGLIALAAARGEAMASLDSPTGAMASLRLNEDETLKLIADVSGLSKGAAGLVIAGLNSPTQTVVSGEIAEIERLMELCRTRGISASRLAVSHAFHSSLVAAAAPALRSYLTRIPSERPLRAIVSTITGERIDESDAIPELLVRQITSPVRFIAAAERAFGDCDLLIETGPGEVLTRLAGDIVDSAVVATDCGSESIAPFLDAVGAAFVAGANPKFCRLYSDRLIRPIDINQAPRFFVNPCETVPTGDGEAGSVVRHVDQASIGRDQAESIDAGMVAPGDIPPLERVRRLVAQRTELPLSSVNDDDRLLADLHLNSISVGQIVSEASKLMGLPPPVSPTAFARATVAEVALALGAWRAETPDHGATIGGSSLQAGGVDTWIRPMKVRLVEAPLVPRQTESIPGGWRFVASEGHPRLSEMRQVFAGGVSGGGVVVLLDAGRTDASLKRLMEAARMIEQDHAMTRLVIVQHANIAESFAKSLHLERPEVDVAVVTTPVDHAESARWIARETSAAAGYVEAHYDADGRRRVPGFEPVWLTETSNCAAGLSSSESGSGSTRLSPDDVVLVSGGGKGIGAECAIQLGRTFGAKIAIIGRSIPQEDSALTATLERLKASGIRAAYAQSDVGDRDSVHAALRRLVGELGEITAIVHAAGVNEPRLIADLDGGAFTATLRPKVEGLRNLLSAVDAGKLRLLVSFGSIISQIGMAGQAEYAVANDWLAAETREWGARHAHCRSLTIDWSVWADVGMGRRLGRVEALAQQGVTPIPTDAGLALLTRILESPVKGRVIVAGRFGAPKTLGHRDSPLPLLRFVEEVRVDVPGMELVVDATLSARTDPYVEDHALHGERIFPAVMAVEAVAQTFQAFSGQNGLPPAIENLELLRPIVVPAKDEVVLRVALLAQGADVVDAVVRSSATDFLIDHFRLRMRRDTTPVVAVPLPAPEVNGHGLIPLDREADLYSELLFHRGRFKRLGGYHRLLARECHAVIEPEAAGQTWFAPWMPTRFVLGDPAARDAAIHAIQSCIPHLRLLPVSVARITRHAPAEAAAHSVRAIERGHDGDVFVYDMQMLDREGTVLESWDGLRLTAVEPIEKTRNWPAALFGNYIERVARQLTKCAGLTVAMEAAAPGNGPVDSTHALTIVAGEGASIRRRPDGKPEASTGRCVTSSHASTVILAAASDGPVGCDMEPVQARDGESWRSLLGDSGVALARQIARMTGEHSDSCATRVWAARESMIKAGLPASTPLTLEQAEIEGWAVLRSGEIRCATFVGSVQGVSSPHAVAILVGACA